MHKGSTVMVEMKAWLVVRLDDEITNQQELIASLEEKSGVPGHVSIADWNSIRLLGILDSKTGAMHWCDGNVQPDFLSQMHDYEKKIDEEKGSKWVKRKGLLK